MKLHVAALLVALTLPTFSASAQAPARHGAPGGERAQMQDGHRPHRPHARAERLRHLRHLARELQPTREQREVVREEVRQAKPQIDAARERAKELLKTAREARKNGQPVPEATKQQLRALRDELRATLQPRARRIVDQLTPEQRGRLEQRARAHGKTCDQARLERGATRLMIGLERLERRRGPHMRDEGGERGPRTR